MYCLCFIFTLSHVRTHVHMYNGKLEGYSQETGNDQPESVHYCTHCFIFHNKSLWENVICGPSVGVTLQFHTLV